MAERQRALPPWMAKKEQKAKEKRPIKTERTRRAVRAAFYCMNEAELVEAACSLLSEGSCEGAMFPLHQQIERKVDPISQMKVQPGPSEMKSKPVMSPLEEESSDTCDEPEMAYGKARQETDLDFTEMETVPYTRNLQHPEGEGSASAQVHCEPNNDMQSEKEREQLQTAAGEDDALQLVREIFFT